MSKAKRTANSEQRTPKAMELPRETPEEISAARAPWVMIVVLAASRQHYEHYRRFFWGDGKTRFINPQNEEMLIGLRPNAIIELPEWWLGKSPAFVDRVVLLKRRIDARPAAQ